MKTIETPVLICGGGGAGLSLSIFLSALGTESLLVERHETTSPLPKAHYLNQRTMEIFHEHGIAETIYRRGTPFENLGRVVWLTSLGGAGPLDQKLIYSMDAFGGHSTQAIYDRDSAMRSGNLPLLRLEPVLREFAERSEFGDVHFNNELLSFEQDADSVTSVVRDLKRGEEYQVRSNYLVGADRGRTIGPKLGIELQGPTNLIDMVSTHFSADLSRHIHDDSPLIRWFINPEGGGGWGSPPSRQGSRLQRRVRRLVEAEADRRRRRLAGAPRPACWLAFGQNVGKSCRRIDCRAGAYPRQVNRIRDLLS